MDLVWFGHGCELDSFYGLMTFKDRFAQAMATIHERAICI